MRRSQWLHISDVPAFPFQILWERRTITSVANVTRRGAEEFVRIAATVLLKTSVETFPLRAANESLTQLHAGILKGTS